MRYAIIAAIVLGMVPVMAEAGSRDRGSRWSVSLGFGSSDYYGSRYHRGGDYFDTRITYSSGYDRGYSHSRYRSGISHRPPRYSHYEPYCPPPVVYRPAPVVYAPPPVVYYPAPVYRYEPCYPSGGDSYYRSSYRYGR